MGLDYDYMHAVGRELADELISSDVFFRPDAKNPEIRKLYLFGARLEVMMCVSQYIEERINEKLRAKIKQVDDSRGKLINGEILKLEEELERLEELSGRLEYVIGREITIDVGDNGAAHEYPVDLRFRFDASGEPKSKIL